MHVPVTLLLLLFASMPALAQREHAFWYFGDSAGVDFAGGAARARLDGAMRTTEACATQSDPTTGALLFYSNGVAVWNAEHERMPNGTGLLGNASVAQGALVVPAPGSAGRYYLFTGGLTSAPVFEGSTENNGVNYSLIDMSADRGLGDVVSRNRPLLAKSIEGLAGVGLCGVDAYWVVAHGLADDLFHAWKVTSDGVLPPVVSKVGVVRGAAGDRGIGWMRFSPDGRTLAFASSDLALVELFAFDPTTGQISDPIAIAAGRAGIDQPYGLCFSPDNRLLYVSLVQKNGPIVQYDLGVRDRAAIEASAIAIASVDDGESLSGALQIGPDGRIYGAAGLHLEVIEHPNERGDACSLRLHAVDLGERISHLGLPNIVDESLGPIGLTSDDTTICEGGTAQLAAPDGLRYRWSPSTGLSCTDCATPTARPSVTTRYTVVVESRFGCARSGAVTVTVAPRPRITLAAPPAVCEGDSVRLRAAGGRSYRWSPSIGLSCVDCPDPIASPALTTTYTLTVDNGAGCAVDTTVEVVVRPRPDADAGDDVAVCTGERATLRARGGVAYAWSPAHGLSCTDCAEPEASPAVTTRYIVEVTGASGCIDRDTLVVSVVGGHPVDAGRDVRVCDGTGVQLEASDGASWRWEPEEGLSCSDCRAPVASPSVTTRYTVTVGSGTCVGTDDVVVEVLPRPDARVGDDVRLCADPSTTLRASGGVSYRWWPSEGLSCDDCAEPVASPTRTIEYVVSVTNELGCATYDSVTVTVGPLASSLSLPSDMRVAPGGRIAAEATLDAALDEERVDALEVSVGFDARLMRYEGLALDGTLLDGWSLALLDSVDGRVRLLARAPLGSWLRGTGGLARVRLRGFIGPTDRGAVTLDATPLDNPCASIAGASGTLRIDSICGLGLRLVEFDASAMALGPIAPNPFNPTTSIGYSLAVDAFVRLRIFDAQGREAARLVDGTQSAGEHAAVFDGARLPSGHYQCVLEAGGVAVGRATLVLVK